MSTSTNDYTFFVSNLRGIEDNIAQYMQNLQTNDRRTLEVLTLFSLRRTDIEQICNADFVHWHGRLITHDLQQICNWLTQRYSIIDAINQNFNYFTINDLRTELTTRNLLDYTYLNRLGLDPYIINLLRQPPIPSVRRTYSKRKRG